MLYINMNTRMANKYTSIVPVSDDLKVVDNFVELPIHGKNDD